MRQSDASSLGQRPLARTERRLMNWNPAAGKPIGRGDPDHGLGGLYHSSPERAKQSFLAAMSHELRTPLNAIIGFSEIMDAEVFGPQSAPQYSEYVRDILGSARRLLHIIEDVLEISRAEAGEMVLSRREVDVAELIDESLRPFRDWCRSRRIKVVTDVPDHIVIHVDPQRIRRVLATLISNAVKFSGDRSTIRIAAGLDEFGLVTMSVKDRGIGMDPQAIERAFVPFAQLDDRLSRQFDGAGLGLSLAQLLVELHDGRIELDSAPGVGTTASIILPAYAATAGFIESSGPA
jgi:two-component system cell cycle sensor histidine kinase PleC